MTHRLQSIPASVRLKRTFAPERLKSDLDRISNCQGSPAGYPGEGHKGWTSICLASIGGNRASGHGDFSGGDHSGDAASLDLNDSCSEEEILAETPYFRQVLDELGCHVRLARLMALAPGGEIKEHHDEFLSFAQRAVRLHIPIVTNADIDFRVAGQRCRWSEGELWYGDFSKPHSVANRSDRTRVHFVVDAHVNGSLAELFPDDYAEILHKWLAHAKSVDRDPSSGFERFECHFLLPPGFRIPGSDYQQLSESVSGSVELIDNELMLFVNGQPLFRLRPCSDDTLEIDGMAPATKVRCDFDEGQVTGATLIVGPSNHCLPLTVTPYVRVISRG